MPYEIFIKKITKRDGTKIVMLLHQPRGAYRFIEYSRLSQRRSSYWVPTHWSGRYATAAEAERDAGEVLPWVRADSRETALS